MPPVLRSKIAQPTSLTDVVIRPALARSIRDSAAPLIMLVAPGGYGKTTLLTEVVGAMPGGIAWINVDAADNDGVRFWTHVLAALSEAGVPVDPSAVASIPMDQLADAAVDSVIAAIESVGAPVTIVLDDAHELIDADVIAACGRLISHPPAGLRLLVSTRTDLAWPISRLQVRNEVLVVDTEALALRGCDGSSVFENELLDGSIEAEAVDAIVRHVDGWPAGLRLAKLALTASGADAVTRLVSGGSPDISRYLADEVLAGRSDVERHFLVTTSVLDELTPAACDAVTERPGSLAILRRLVADRVFTTQRTDDTSTFDYHRVLREYLLSRLDERPPDEVRDIHDRAIAYHRDTGDVGAVISHAVRSGQTDVALEALSGFFLEAANTGRIGELWRWVDEIGVEHVLAHPDVGPMPGWASLNLGRYDEIDPWLEAHALIDDTSDAARASFDLHAAAIRCHRDRHIGRLDESVVHARHVLQLVEDLPDDIVVSSALAAAGTALVLDGNSSEGTEVLEAAIVAAQVGHERSSIVLAYSFLALAADDPNLASAQADSALALVDTPALEDFNRPAIPWLVRGSLALAAGQVGDAETAFERAAAHAQAGREPLVSALVSIAAAELHHLLGRADRSRSELRDASHILDEASGVDWIRQRLQQAQAATRFAPTDSSHLPPGANDLSERELAVLRLLPHDLPRRELAQQLFISENTLKTHLTSIRHKLGVRGRGDVTARARELGLLDDG